MEFKIDTLPQDFNTSIQSMEKRVNAIINQTKEEMTWLLNYPAIYTCGASKNDDDLLDKSKFPIFKTNRGGKYTYHGPGQRIINLICFMKLWTLIVLHYLIGISICIIKKW